MDAINIGVAGIYAATERFEASAERTAKGTGDYATEAVEQISAKTALKANVAVIKTADQMTKRLLDIKA